LFLVSIYVLDFFGIIMAFESSFSPLHFAAMHFF
jgi:hypothetical protein